MKHQSFQKKGKYHSVFGSGRPGVSCSSRTFSSKIRKRRCFRHSAQQPSYGTAERTTCAPRIHNASKTSLACSAAAQGGLPRVAHVSDDGNPFSHKSFCLCYQRGEELGLPVAAADVVIQLAATRVTQRLRAVERQTPLRQIFRIYALACYQYNAPRRQSNSTSTPPIASMMVMTEEKLTRNQPSMFKIKHAVHGIHRASSSCVRTTVLSLTFLPDSWARQCRAQRLQRESFRNQSRPARRASSVAAAAVVGRAVVIDAHW